MAAVANTDEQLAAACAAGDQAAFHALAQRYTQPAFNYAYHVLGSYDDASDAVQEALIQVYGALPRSQTGLPFRPWFYRILRNKCLDGLRRRKPFVRVPTSSAENDGVAWDQLPDGDPLPDELYERRDLQQLLHLAIGGLPLKYRDVVVLRYTTDLTFEEIGDALGLPVNTVKTHFQRAKALLRSTLADLSAPGGGLDSGPARTGRVAGRDVP